MSEDDDNDAREKSDDYDQDNRKNEERNQE